MPDDRRATAEDRVLRAPALRALERAALDHAAEGELMERAGVAVARVATTMTAERPGFVLCLAGPGNNGGDALVAARLLVERGIDARVATLAPPERFMGDAARAWSRWQALGIAPVDPLAAIDRASLVVDGLFGIGGDRAPEGLARDWIVKVGEARRPVLAIDIPSGVDADTGHVAGAAIVADRTVSFFAAKPGLYTGDGVDHAGAVTIDVLGADETIDREVGFANADAGAINRPTRFAGVGRARRKNSHKGDNGSVAVIGGDDGMVGAALMASRTALHAGAGRVYVRLVAADAPSYDVLQPELMLRDSLDGVDADAVAIGPGLGHGDEALGLLADTIAKSPALCVDADGLNAIAKDARLADLLRARTTPAVLTPHPLEAARLLGTDAKDVQRDRIAAATTLASRFASVVVLKGAGTIVAEPDGTWVVNTTGNPALGTGGTGDVLSGLVAGLLAQRGSPADAARAAVWLHGTAADDLVAAGVGSIGLVATELIVAIRRALNRLGDADGRGVVR